MSERPPWFKEGQTTDEASKAFDSWFADREAILNQLQTEEKEFVHGTADRIRAAGDEKEFLEIVEDIKKNSQDIHETVAVYQGHGFFEVSFPDSNYKVYLTVRPRRHIEEKDEPIAYSLDVIKS